MPITCGVPRTSAEEHREIVLRDRVSPGADLDRLCADVQAAGERMWAEASKGDWAGRDIDALSPQSFPAFREQRISKGARSSAMRGDEARACLQTSVCFVARLVVRSH